MENSAQRVTPLTTTPPMVSVLLCTYNGGRYLAASVSSILSQSFEDFELVLVDDGSTDESVKTIELIDDARINIIKKPNTGLTHSLNVGIKHCRGKYVARQDADDFSHPHRFQAQVMFLESHSHVGVLGSAVNLIDDDDDVIGALSFDQSHEALLRSHLETNQFVHGSLMIRRRVLNQVGGYREAFTYAQDYDLTLRCQEITALANLAEKCYSLRFGSQRISINNAAHQRSCANMARAFAQQRRETGTDDLQSNDYDGDVGKFANSAEADADQVLIMLYLYLRSDHNKKARKCLKTVLQRPLSIKQKMKYRASYLISFLPSKISKSIYLSTDRLRKRIEEK